MKSWKTTLFGAGGLVTIVANIASVMLDGDPKTVVDWGVTIPAISVCIATLFAKDFNVSGSKPEPEEPK
jgi:hypothetical protein